MIQALPINKTLPEEEFVEVECSAYKRNFCHYILFSLGVLLLFLPFARSTSVSFFHERQFPQQQYVSHFNSG